MKKIMTQNCNVMQLKAVYGAMVVKLELNAIVIKMLRNFHQVILYADQTVLLLILKKAPVWLIRHALGVTACHLLQMDAQDKLKLKTNLQLFTGADGTYLRQNNKPGMHQ